MSELERLIQEYCPNGVLFKTIDELCDVFTGGEAPADCIKGKPADDVCKYPVYSNGINENAIYGYSAGYVIDKTSVTFSSIGTIGHPEIREAKFTPIIRLKVIIPKNDNVLSVGFLKYALEVVDFTQNKSSVPNVNAKMIKAIKVPVPPIEIQNKIVRILDNFKKRTAELTEELTAELTARKKQYEYYKEHLLTFEPERVKNNSVKLLQLGDLCNVSAGGDAPKEAMSKEKTDDFTIPIISNGIGANAFYGYTNIEKITTPSVTVAARGTIGYAEYRDYSYFPIIRLLSANPKDTSVLNTKYLYYCLQGKQYSVPSGGIPQLTAPELKKVKIFVPPIEEQMRIVSILDRFDFICNDISASLPAEIEARQKQYEWYRDKLLNF